MKSLLSIIILLALSSMALSSMAWGQCPGGTCRPAEPAKRTVSILSKTVVRSVEVTKQRIERRSLLRRVFRRSR